MKINKKSFSYLTNIHINVFRPAHDSSVWLGLMSREQLISPECSKHPVLSLDQEKDDNSK